MNKCLAQSNKSQDGDKATKKREIRQPGLIRQTCHVLAAMNKCLAQSNKSQDGDKATKKREIRQPGLIGAETKRRRK
jgi:hypothetical protein